MNDPRIFAERALMKDIGQDVLASCEEILYSEAIVYDVQFDIEYKGKMWRVTVEPVDENAENNAHIQALSCFG